ncbi:hypothetical protein AgCh_035343 [Apium graveolens]
MPSRLSLGQGSGEGSSQRARDRRLIVKIRPPKPIRNAIVTLTGANGIVKTIYYSRSSTAPSSNFPEIVHVDGGMPKDNEKAPGK